MKIGVLIDELLAGGVQKTAVEETRHLLQQGEDAELLVLHERSEGYQYEDLLKGVPVRFLSEQFPILEHSLKIPSFNVLSTYHIVSFFVAPFSQLWRRFDVIISHGAFASAVAWNVWKLYGIRYIPFVWDPATYIFKKVYSKSRFNPFVFTLRPILTMMEGSIMNDATLILSPSNVHAETLMKDYKMDRSKIKTIYPACSPAEKTPEKRGDYLISFTRWESSKNPFFLIDLMERLPNARLIVAGEWTDKQGNESFLQKIKEKGIEERIVVHPAVKKSEIPKLCSTARVWVHPNFEAFGMGALEVASQGCPIIMPKGSGATELFEHGVHGFFPEQGDLETYTEYASKLLSDERLAWKMGYEAWQIAKKHTWENHVRNLLEVI